MYEQWVIQPCGCGSCVLHCLRVASWLHKNIDEHFYRSEPSNFYQLFSSLFFQHLQSESDVFSSRMFDAGKREQDPFQNDSKGRNSGPKRWDLIKTEPRRVWRVLWAYGTDQHQNVGFWCWSVLFFSSRGGSSVTMDPEFSKLTC